MHINHKHNLKHENQLILLMITDGKKRCCPAVKKLSALFNGITSNHKGEFYCLNCFYSNSTGNKFKKNKTQCKNHYCYCYVEMPKEDDKILKYNHGEKPMKVPFIIYADLDSLLEKINTCHNNTKKSTTKINKHTPSGLPIVYTLFI